MARRLFEIGGDVQPDLTYRLAAGKAGTATTNSSWQTIVTWLETKLGFLKVNSNFSDVEDASIARSNINVYSISAVDSALTAKADTTNVLEKDNTTTYTPSLDYHPATFKSVNDGGTRTALLDCTAQNHISNFAAKAIQVGAVVYVTGQLEIDTTPGTDTLFTLPAGVGVPPTDWFFLAGDGDGVSSEIAELKVITGTRNVRAVDHSTNKVMSFCFSYPVAL